MSITVRYRAYCGEYYGGVTTVIQCYGDEYGVLQQLF
jgi:hypothetical protein